MNNSQLAFREAILKSVKGGVDAYDVPNTPQARPMIRYRPPFIQTPAHDAKGDGIWIACEQLMTKGIPYHLSICLAHHYIENYKTQLKLEEEVEFIETVYNGIDGTYFCPQVLKYIQEYLIKVDKGEIAPPEMPEAWDQWEYCYAVCKNKRPKMEDKMSAIPSLDLVKKGNTMSFFSVYDGHNGPEISSYLAAHFHHVLASQTDGDINKILNDAFLELDKRVTVRCEKEHLKSGSTVMSAIVTKEKVFLGWVGDSEAALYTKDGVRMLIKPHIPSDKNENDRIVACGGIIIPIAGELRVCGVLNLTRSLGDTQGKPMISSDPDYVELEHATTKHQNNILILASDGIWGSLNTKEIETIVDDFLATTTPEEYRQLAQTILNKAIEEGASDNLSIICVFLTPVAEVYANRT
uniref:PPM-type phosphatase domain-containing protein n=1 Tax=Rhabditophanes sp. KR3021 TaxID=114890 RepID=A0AC35TKL4_9BILA